MGFLSDLTAQVRRDLLSHPPDVPGLMARAALRPPARDMAGALRARTPAVIAEVKRASPSAGPIAQDRDLASQAVAYVAGGAAALSILTEPHHFHGSLTDLEAARLAVAVPVLRKDFLVDPAQVIEARAHGADAVLLIAASLTELELRAMLAAAADLGMGALVETHTDEDLRKALATDAEMIGVNARDLESLQVDVDRALHRLRDIPSTRLAVMESGVSTRTQLVAAVDAGASAILVGEALMRARDPAAKLRELLGEEPER